MHLLQMLAQVILPRKSIRTRSTAPSMRAIHKDREVDRLHMSIEIGKASEVGPFGGALTAWEEAGI